jgi:serine/threonine protein kinase
MSNRFLSSGVYGCVYYPSYSCKGEELNNKTYVTKLVKYDFTSKTEIHIGKKLMNHNDEFILVEKKCEIKNDNLKRSTMTPQCELLKKDSKLQNKYILLYSKFVKAKELADYLKSNTSTKLIIQTFLLICKRIDVLIKNGIIHHDLHFGNILLNDKQLYVIDFGLSMIQSQFYIDKNTVNYNYLKEVIFNYSPSWKYWTLEYHFICFLINEDDKLTPEVIDYTVKTYLSEHKIIKSLGESFLNKFKMPSIKFFNKFIHKPKNDVILELLSYSNTWDFYKTSLHYLDIYYDVKMDDPAFLMLTLMMIHPDPTFRPSKIEMLSLLEIYKQQYSSTVIKPVKQLSAHISKELRKDLTVNKAYL